MAYGVGWDPSSPDGAITPAADIDVEIQNVKTAIGERLVEFVPEWADDLKQPKKIAIVYGALSARPAAPDFPGEMYFATDTQTLFIADATPAWLSTGGIVEEGEDVPSTTFFVAGHLAALKTIPATDTWTKLSGYVITNQSGSFYDSGFPSRFTVTTPGSYLLIGSFGILPSNSPTTVSYGTNGSNPIASLQTPYVGGVSIAAASFSAILTFPVAGYIEFFAKCSGGSDAYIQTTSGITIHRLP